MNPRLRALIGVITTCLFAGMAVTLFSSGRDGLGLAIGALAAFRGYYAVRQLRDAFGPDDDD